MDQYTASCPCDCHGRFKGACSTEGGCGHLHKPQAAHVEVEDGEDEIDRSHRCQRDKRCTEAEKLKVTVKGQTGPDGRPGTRDVWVGGPITTPEGLCRSCTRTVAQAIREIPMDYAELQTLLGVPPASSDVMVSFSRDLPIPIRLAIKTLQEAIDHEVTCWAEPIADKLGVTWDTNLVRYRMRPGHRIKRAALLLEPNVETLLALPVQDMAAWESRGVRAPLFDEEGKFGDYVELTGLDGGLRLLRLHDLVRLTAGRTRLVHRLPAPCPHCEQLALVRYDGSDQVDCERCKRSWPEEDYKRLCHILAFERTTPAA